MSVLSQKIYIKISKNFIQFKDFQNTQSMIYLFHIYFIYYIYNIFFNDLRPCI